MRRAIRAAPLLLALLPAILWGQEAEKPEELLRRADSLSAEGDGRSATVLYREWLQANPGSESFGEVLLRAVDSASQVSDALRLLADFPPRLGDPSAREAFLERQVALLRLAGRLEEALAAQLGLPETPARLVERASLSFELGLAGDAEQILLKAVGSADEEAGTAARFLLASLYLATGREGQAEAELRAVAASHPNAAVVPGALLALGETLRGRGESKEAEVVFAELKARFPASPEAALAGTGREVRYAASPGRLLPPEPPAPATPPLPSPPAVPQGSRPEAGKAVVQAGSFRDPENAQYLVRDLNARGFAARVMEKAAGGSRYYRVLVGPEQDTGQAQELILRLKDAGYEGFLLLE